MLFDKKGHLTEETISALCRGSLTPEERLHAAEHLASCIECAGLLAKSLAPGKADVPAGFAEQVLLKAEKSKPDQKQFLLYSLRVSFAACAALVLLFSGVFNRLPDIEKVVKAPDLQAVSSVTASLSDFSNKLLNLEVFNNEKEKK